MTGSAVSEAIGQTDTEMTDARPPDPSGAGSAVSLPTEDTPRSQRPARGMPCLSAAHTDATHRAHSTHLIPRDHIPLCKICQRSESFNILSSPKNETDALSRPARGYPLSRCCRGNAYEQTTANGKMERLQRRPVAHVTRLRSDPYWATLTFSGRSEMTRRRDDEMKRGE